MRSSFFEINIATTGLFAAQKGLAVTGNNITNATTPGYSRQQLVQRASTPLSGFGTGMVGTGVETISVNRVRNSYLDSKLWAQNDKLGEYSVKAQQNALVESVFGEPSDSGFTALFDDFYQSIDDLSKLPQEAERKEAIKQTLESFTKYFNSASESLSEYQKDLNFEISTMVDEINLLATRIQSLNKQIYQAEMYGDVANTLRDERELCIDRLSQLANIEVKEKQIPTGIKDANGNEKMELRYEVKLNGQSLVDHFEVNTLQLTAIAPGDKTNPGEDVEGLYKITWDNGLDFDMYGTLSGELRGAIDMRDGSGTDDTDPNKGNTYRGIPYYVKKLDQFASQFANSLNKIYNQVPDPANEGQYIQAALTKVVNGVEEEVLVKAADGTDLRVPKYTLLGATPDGQSIPGDMEAILKKDADGNYVDEDGDGFADLDITAKTMSLSYDVYKGSENIRTNFEHDPATGTNPNPGANDLLMALVGTKNDIHMFKEGDPKDFMISMFSELGINAKEANMYKSTQTNIIQTIENQRLSVSQVDTNEEFLNLIKYNQAYQAAAKIISTMDGIYETTIFKLGAW